MKTRRKFLKSCCTLAAAGAGAHLTRLGMVSARAQSVGGHRALVCVFLFGGNDSNNMIVPVDSTRYNQYRTMRGPIALPQANLLPIAVSGQSYGLHPRLTNLQRIFGQQRAAAVFNVGTLVRPTTRTELNSAMLPRNLYSHSDQTQQWQTSDPNGGGTGWAGRVNDVLFSSGGNTLPPGITLSGGNALLLSGVTTKGLNFSDSGSFGLTTFGSEAGMNARIAGMERIITFDSGLRMLSAANTVLGDSIKTAKEINAALDAAPALPVTFPQTGLGNQLAQAARLISVHNGLGMSRQIFFAGLGGFDHHEDLLARHDDLMGVLDGAIGAFQAAMEAMSVSDSVTLFTESEFNRTGNSNANIGSDHGWGGHHFVVGGAVRGGVYGAFPAHVLRGPDDAGDRGNFIPKIPLDQYAATLATWFGVSEQNLAPIFPNLANFPSPRPAFL